MRVKLGKHFNNPFKQDNIEIRPWQKGLSIIAGIVCGALFLIPGIVAFFAVSGYFKNKLLTKLAPHNPSVKDIHDTALTTLGMQQSPKDRFLHLCKLHKVDSLISEEESIEESLMKLIADQPETYKNLFTVQLKQNDHELLKEFVKVLLDHAYNNKAYDLVEHLIQITPPNELQLILEELDTFKLEFGDKIIYSHRALLELYDNNYFKSLFSSSFKESGEDSLSLPSGEYSIFSEIYAASLGHNSLTISVDNCRDYLELVCKYDFKTVQASIEEWLISNFDQWQPKNEVYLLIQDFNLAFTANHLANKFFNKELHLSRGPVNLLSASSQAQEIEEFIDFLLRSVKTLKIERELSKDQVSEILPYLQKCKNLKELELITDSSKLLSCLEELNSLEIVKLKIPKATNEICKKITSLPIQELDLSDSPITDEAMKSIASLPLTKLNLSRTTISAQGMSELVGQQIEEIYLAGCACITGKALDHLASMPIQKIDLSNTNITNKDLERLKELSLREIYLDNCRSITDQGLSLISHMPIQKIGLSYTQITDAAIDDFFLFADNKTIQEINLEGTKITNLTLSKLVGQPIKKIKIGRTLVNADGFVHLKQMPLEEISLHGLKSISKRLNPLKDLQLRVIDFSATDVKNDDLKLFEKMSVLEWNLSSTNISYKGLKLINPQVQVLNCSNTKLSNWDFNCLKALKKCNYLHSLDLTDTGISHSDLNALIDKPLQHLYIGHNHHIRDIQMLKDLKLKTLDISYTKVESLEFSTGMPLETLNLMGLESIDDQRLQLIETLPISNLTIAFTSVTQNCLSTLLKLPLRNLVVRARTNITNDYFRKPKRINITHF